MTTDQANTASQQKLRFACLHQRDFKMYVQFSEKLYSRKSAGVLNSLTFELNHTNMAESVRTRQQQKN